MYIYLLNLVQPMVGESLCLISASFLENQAEEF